MCSFTGSASDWAVQKPCFESLQSYCDAMEENLVRFGENMAALGQDAQTEHQDMLDKAARCLRIMRSSLVDRFNLKTATGELKD